MGNELRLRPYQDTAADFLYAHDRAMILAPVGAGKTAITLTAMQAMLADGHVKRWLVLAPKRVCTDVWPVEAPKWAPGMKVAVAVGTPKQRVDAFAGDAQVVVTNYDNIERIPGGIGPFDGIVFDELTRLKNPAGKRFKALEKIIGWFKYRWGLTGSFTSNGLEDVFGQCKMVDQQMLGRSKGAFLQQYFHCVNRDFGDYVPLPGALDAVMQRIRPWTYVLESHEYRDTLPPLHTLPIKLQMPMEPYKTLKREMALIYPNAEVIAANAAAVTSKLQQMSAVCLRHGPTNRLAVRPQARCGRGPARREPACADARLVSVQGRAGWATGALPALADAHQRRLDRAVERGADRDAGGPPCVCRAWAQPARAIAHGVDVASMVAGALRAGGRSVAPRRAAP